MRRPTLRLTLFAAVLLLALLFSGCGASSADAGQPAPSPTALPTQPPRPGTFYFTTSDGVTLSGEIFGRGKTALIFSNSKGLTMGTWETVAHTMADHGYMSFLYDYRGLGQSQGMNLPARRENDLRAAVASARAHGAVKIVLIGSSFGGLISASLAQEVHAAAIVLLSAPLRDSGIFLSDDELRALTVPKLLMTSTNDTSFINDTKHIYDMSPQPKQILVYPGRDHGMAILMLDH
ncbi:MAG TPA: alpha/beta fold hydrolase, partial [Ktedonobacterales bacterium]|nr:alpha/beta fold hydrolase [Ktedonobacterales bacterium]